MNVSETIQNWKNLEKGAIPRASLSGAVAEEEQPVSPDIPDTSRSASMQSDARRRFNTPVEFLESSFECMGQLIGSYPLASVFFAISFAAFAGFGLLTLKIETDPNKLWVDSASKFAESTEFIRSAFPDYVEKHSVIMTSDNVLTRRAMKSVIELDQTVRQFKETDVLCYRALGECVVLSVLDHLRYLDISSSSDILDVVNSHHEERIYIPSSLAYSTLPDNLSPVQFLGGIERNASGAIVKARATKLIYLIKKPIELKDQIIYNRWTESFQWLNSLVLPEISKIYVSLNSRWDGSFEPSPLDSVSIKQVVMNRDAMRIFLSLAIAFAISAVFNSQISLVGHAVLLSVCVPVMYILVNVFTFGLSSLLGFSVTLLHYDLLLLNIVLFTPGIYAIQDEAAKLYEREFDLSLAEFCGLVLRFSAIPIVSFFLMSIVVFGIFLFDSIPALQSFAFFGLVMTLAIFAFQLIFFTPCVLIRYRNLSSGRDACFLCITYADASSGGLLAWSPSHLLRSVFYWLGKILTNTIVKIVALLITLGVFCASIYGILFFHAEFDSLHYTDVNSLSNKYQRADVTFFNTTMDENTVAVYFGPEFDYLRERQRLNKLHRQLRFNPWLKEDSFVSWWITYENWVEKNEKFSGFPTTDVEFRKQIFRFLGQHHVHSDVKLVFGQGELPKIHTSRIWFKLNHTDSIEIRAFALGKIEQLLSESGLQPIFVYSNAIPRLSAHIDTVEKFWRNMLLAAGLFVIIGWVLLLRFSTGVVLIIFVVIAAVLPLGILSCLGVRPDGFLQANLLITLALSAMMGVLVMYNFVSKEGEKNARARVSMANSAVVIVISTITTPLMYFFLYEHVVQNLSLLFLIHTIQIASGTFLAIIFVPTILHILAPEPLDSVKRYLTDPWHPDGKHILRSLHAAQFSQVPRLPRLYPRRGTFEYEASTETPPASRPISRSYHGMHRNLENLTKNAANGEQPSTHGRNYAPSELSSSIAHYMSHEEQMGIPERTASRFHPSARAGQEMNQYATRLPKFEHNSEASASTRHQLAPSELSVSPARNLGTKGDHEFPRSSNRFFKYPDKQGMDGHNAPPAAAPPPAQKPRFGKSELKSSSSNVSNFSRQQDINSKTSSESTSKPLLGKVGKKSAPIPKPADTPSRKPADSNSAIKQFQDELRFRFEKRNSKSGSTTFDPGTESSGIENPRDMSTSSSGKVQDTKAVLRVRRMQN